MWKGSITGFHQMIPPVKMMISSMMIDCLTQREIIWRFLMSPDRGVKLWISVTLPDPFDSKLFLKLMRTFASIFLWSKMSGKNFFYYCFSCSLNSDKFEKHKGFDLWTLCGLSLFTKQNVLIIDFQMKNRPQTSWSRPPKLFEELSRTPVIPTPDTKRCNLSKKHQKTLLMKRLLISFQLQLRSLLIQK